MQAKCKQASVAREAQQQGYTVADLPRARESFPLPCGACLRHLLRAWRLKWNIDKLGARATIFEDLVSVRVEYVVVTFAFRGIDHEPTYPEEFVKNVLEH